MLDNNKKKIIENEITKPDRVTQHVCVINSDNDP